MKIAIVGGGAAGTACATRLRRLNENDEIVIFEKSGELALSNCGLPYLLSGIVEDGKVLIGTTPEQMKQKYNIDCRLNAEVEFINRKEKSVTVKGREPESYDKLIIATGAYQLRPDINGILGEQIFTVNNLESIYKIKDFVKYNRPRNVVIMGGGYTGVEMAENLMRLGLKVSIVEASPHLLPGLDYDMAATLHNYLRGKGLRLYLNRRLTGFGDSKVTLDNGLTIEYDMAVVATGVRPDPKLTIMSDLEIGKSGGIKVDDHMQTSDKDIYAAGDDVEVTDFITRQPVRMAQAGLAVKEAKVIADHLGGLDSRFEHALGTSIIKVFEMTAASAGANEEKLKRQAFRTNILIFTVLTIQPICRTMNFCCLNCCLMPTAKFSVHRQSAEETSAKGLTFWLWLCKTECMPPGLKMPNLPMRRRFQQAKTSSTISAPWQTIFSPNASKPLITKTCRNLKMKLC